ncbi:DNA topoisomerase IV subunit A [Labrys wisconsinensis]|uniref:DNA topoisomerase 4 subunit A n=1 Tax=Labrys wisconsinensis TaxID=425677 RepID=A0ABU0JBF9_9HYPH|nr:DNA topoisomerase IV subunit A [Labrys wisconsinensis]MDQ0471605.1 topoisomerase-4 subunit A [Labrys wisconsinensis]
MDEAEAPPPGGEIESVNLREALEKRYLAYALSTIMHRALPDARDGLKPVHRRILYGMQLLRLDPDAAFKKCAKIVGDVMGSFHPHGDQAIYDALVRLAQDFSTRYPLVDGQGNFGNIDGDNPAAYRYTEARMTAVSGLILEGIDEDAVDFRPNYDGQTREPAVLPGAFPNLLANGAQGIAVGMATSIPPQNAYELCQAALHLIENPKATTAELMRFVQGPDFPTGGIVVDSPAIIEENYSTGRGGFRVRARWHKEDLGRGTWVAVVTEIPWLVQKGRLIEKVAELLNERKLPLVADVRDESAEDVRIVIEPKSRNVDETVMMESLFKLSELESRIPLNMNVLVGGTVPRVLSLGEALQQWLDHRREVLLRRSRHRLAAIEKRLEILDGYIVAYLNLDEVIRIIRFEDEPKAKLIETFSLTDMQAEAILNMRLRNLRRLEEMELRREHDGLSKEKADIEKLLASDARQWKTVAWQVGEVAKTYGPDTRLGKRRTTIDASKAASIDLATVAEAMVEREPVTIVVSEKGWIRAMKGHLPDLSTLAFKGDDRMKLSFFTETTAKLLVFATNGKIYTLEASKLPGGRSGGEPIRLMVDLDEGADVVTVFPFVGGRKFLVAATDGRGFVVAEDEMLANTRKGKAVLNVDAPAEARLIVPALGDRVAVIGENRKLVVFPLHQVPEMARGRGVRLQKYRDGGLSDARVFAAADGLTWTDTSGRTWTVTDLTEWTGNRADAGRLPPKGFPKNNRF